MATTFVDYTGDGNATKQFSFPSIKESDIKVDVDGVIKTSGNHYNITSYTTTGGGNVVFTSGNIPASPAAIRIFRDTDVDAAKATFVAGSSVKAGDLNNNMTQVLYASQEEQNQTILTSKIKDGAVTTAKIKADNITSALIADDQINSEHYVDGSIDTAHIADSQITSAKIADGTIVAGDLASDAVTTAKIADSNVTTAKIADANVTENKIATDAVTQTKIADGAVIVDKLSSGVVTTAKIAADAVTGAKIADDAIDSEHYTDGSIDTAHIGNTQVTDAKLASNSVTTSKITDANVTTVKIADSNVTLAKLASDLKQTSISNSDTQIPTSGAVVDYVAAQIGPIGGLEVIATEVAFPNTQPAAGVVISIADAGGIVVTNSGTSTTGRTVGGSTVTINNINSAFNSSTVDAGVSFMVSSTGSGQIYNFHKATLKESDILNLSNDINDFGNRYRVFSGEPSSNNDDGDLVWDTNANKMKVYDATASAWTEVTSTGDFKYLFLCPAGGSGAPTLNGSIATYDLRESSNSGSAASITSAAQLLVSVNGVVQKANTGTSAPAEGFALVDSNTIIFGANLQSGDSVFIVQIGSAVSIPTPGDSTVTAAKIASGAVETAKIADDAVTEVKLGISNAGTNGQFLSKQSGNTGGLTWATVNTDLVSDTSPQLGGDLDLQARTVTTSTTNGNIKLLPDGTGVVEVRGVPTLSDGSSKDAAIKLNCAQNSHGQTIQAPPHSAGVSNTFTLPTSATSGLGGSGAFLKTSSTGQISFDSNGYQVAGNDIYLTAAGRKIEFGRGTSIVFDSDDNNTYEISITAPQTLTKNSSYTLPEDGSNGQVLTTNGSGTMSWADASGGGAVGGGSDKVFMENGQTVTTSYTIGTEFGAACNALSAGPITINNGVTVTIDSGDNWTIV